VIERTFIDLATRAFSEIVALLVFDFPPILLNVVTVVSVWDWTGVGLQRRRRRRGRRRRRWREERNFEA